MFLSVKWEGEHSSQGTDSTVRGAESPWQQAHSWDAPSPTLPSGDAGAVGPSEGGSRHPHRAMLVSGWVPSQTEPRDPSRERQGGAWLHPNSETGLRGGRTGQALDLENLGPPAWGSSGRAISWTRSL